MNRIGVARDAREHDDVRVGDRLGIDGGHPDFNILQKIAVLLFHRGRRFHRGPRFRQQ